MNTNRITSLLISLSLLTLAFASQATAGQFKTLDDVASLAQGGNVQAYSSPKNTSLAMEMETYEWKTGPTDRYRCSIFSNVTGQDLQLKLVGLTGSAISSCVTAVNGTCSTTCANIVGGAKFSCTVTSGYGSPIAGNTSFYGIRVERCSASMASVGVQAVDPAVDSLSVEQRRASGLAD